MRARNIKPALFKNELLGQADPLFTLVFVGLWCAADRDGRLEDRPARLRIELVPYRYEFDIEAALSWLQNNGFIDRYSVDSVAIIQVIKFAEHQRPHSNEVPSVLPPKVSSAPSQGRNGLLPRKAALCSDPLLSDPGYLNADPGVRIADSPSRPAQETHTPLSAKEQKRWAEVRHEYPGRRPTNIDLGAASRSASKLVRDGRATWPSLITSVCKYADYCSSALMEPMSIVAFFGANDEPWACDWHPPLAATAEENPPASRLQ